jgi:hypothetical protein
MQGMGNRTEKGYGISGMSSYIICGIGFGTMVLMIILVSIIEPIL